jgi:hypothetical protein
MRKLQIAALQQQRNRAATYCSAINNNETEARQQVAKAIAVIGRSAGDQSTQVIQNVVTRHKPPRITNKTTEKGHKK